MVTCRETCVYCMHIPHTSKHTYRYRKATTKMRAIFTPLVCDCMPLTSAANRKLLIFAGSLFCIYPSALPCIYAMFFFIQFSSSHYNSVGLLLCDAFRLRQWLFVFIYIFFCMLLSIHHKYHHHRYYCCCCLLSG